MQAKDTVMSNGALLKRFGTPDFTERDGREAQAEISFKVGYEQHKEESNKALEILGREIQEKLDEEHKAGMREVVGWIKDYGLTEYYWKKDLGIVIPDKLWQAKLEEWGVKDDCSLG